jgi:hypothetical protein
MERTDQDNNPHELQEDISIHIFAASAAMIGVCLTVIGIFQISSLKAIGSISDNLLAIDAIVFLLSCLVSYSLLRSGASRHRHFLKRVADVLFIAGLCLMAVVCSLIAYELV